MVGQCDHDAVCRVVPRVGAVFKMLVWTFLPDA